MFSKPLHEITPADIYALVGKVKEDMVTEFKQEIKAKTDGEKKELLADVSSFANASGGYLVFGMATTKGVASAVTPVATTDEDALALHLRSVIRDGIEPDLPFELHAVTMGRELTVITIRIDEGVQKPYGITFNNSGKFFSRDGNGKYHSHPSR